MPMTKGQVVLVVDDDDLVRKVVRAVLEADDYEVLEAPNGQLALEMITERKPHLVILDVMMPGIDGVDVCRRMDHGDARVLMLTARDDLETEDASRAAGADDFLAKPFSSLELLEHVQKLVGT
jgi:DNA-binding response OmpR family regulator